MHATTVAVDLAKSVFQLAVVDEQWRIVDTQHLTRSPFERWIVNCSVGLTNKLARICYATLRDHAPFDEAARLSRKAGRQSFAIPA